MNNPILKINLLIACINILAISILQAQTEKNRAFDFWIGEWDVNLRVYQQGNTWKDQHLSSARIYSLLDGNAILELWEEKDKPNGIIGYSLRHFDKDENKWTIWLNWPGKNRSGTTSLKGNFRHGRGEFFSSRAIDDSTTLLSRYTFSDITTNSLRWDDAYSKDSGKTWTNNWIMEFSRSKGVAPQLLPGNENHTNHALTRCDLSQFNLIKKLSEYESINAQDSLVFFYGILDGCSVITLLKSVNYDQLSVLTFNTYAQVYEELVFDNISQKAEIYYGKITDGTLRLSNRNNSRSRKVIIERNSYQLDEFSQGEKTHNILIKEH